MKNHLEKYKEKQDEEFLRYKKIFEEHPEVKELFQNDKEKYFFLMGMRAANAIWRKNNLSRICKER